MKFLLVFLVTIFARSCIAAPYDVSFAKFVVNQPARQSEFYGVSTFSNGDAVVGGWANGLVGPTFYGHYDFLLQRYSPAGALIWSAQIGGDNADLIGAVAVDPNNNDVYAVGWSYGDFDGYTSASPTRSDCVLAKFDSSGNKIFSKQIGGNHEDTFNGVVVDSLNGVFYAVGITYSSTFNGVPITGRIDGTILKLSSATGAILAHHQFGVATKEVFFRAIVQDPSGDIWVTGYTNAATYLSQTSNGNTDIILQRLNPAGATVLVFLVGGPSSEVANAIAIDSSNNLYCAGVSSASVHGQAGLGAQDILVIKFNNAGVRQWTKVFGGSSHDLGYAIAVDSAQGLVYVTGMTQSPTFYGMTNPIMYNNYHAFLLVLDAATGSRLYSTLYPSSAGGSVGRGIATSGARTYVAGRAGGNLQGQTFTGTLNDAFVLGLEGYTRSPTALPTALNPTAKPTSAPPSISPTTKPSCAPSFAPTDSPSRTPTRVPSAKPSVAPTAAPTRSPSATPTVGPTALPSSSPTFAPSSAPTSSPSVAPTVNPTAGPTANPSAAPTDAPSADPSVDPSMAPTVDPTADPTVDPTANPSVDPTVVPTALPSADPTFAPTVTPSADPTTDPTVDPTAIPSVSPTVAPSMSPSADPSVSPTANPTEDPSVLPTADPSAFPTVDPTASPSASPTAVPTVAPSVNPTADPTVDPTAAPSVAPTVSPTADPSASPSAAPTEVPTAAPTRVCLQWTLGDFEETCSATCSRLDRVCKNSYFDTVITQEAFYLMVGSAVNVRTGGAVGPVESFCGPEASYGPSVGAPAALSVVYFTSTIAPVRNTCSYPSSTAHITVDCDTVLPVGAFRRFCPCVDHNCDDEGGAWFLGYTGDSCDATCSNAGGVCQADPLPDIVDADSFQGMIATATVIGTNEVIGSAAAPSFCSGGTNLLEFASAPAAVTLFHGAFNQTLCTYPTSLNALQGECELSFQTPPAQRFCNCRITSGARRLSVAVEVTPEEAPDKPNGVVAPSSRLRGGHV